MIIKSMGRRKTTARNGQSVFASLLNYFLKEKGSKIDISHNIPAHYYQSEIIDTFADNARYLHERKNGNLAYHEIISFPVSQQDRGKVNTALQNIGRVYLEERAPQNIAVGVIHNDKDHVHLHLMLSANKLYERNRVRLSKEDFLAIQERVATKAQTLYPEFGLENLYTPDNIRSNARESVRLTQGQQQQKVHRKTAPLSRKEQLSELLHGLLDKYHNKTSLEAILRHNGLSLYQRGQTVGLVDQDGKKHHLSTLGVMPRYQEWQQEIHGRVSQKETLKATPSIIKRDLRMEAEQNIAELNKAERQRQQREITDKVEAETRRRIGELQRAKALQVAKERLETLEQTPPTQEPKAPPIPAVKWDLLAQTERRIAELEQAENARQRQAQAQANIEALHAAQAEKEAQAKAEARRLQAAKNIQALEQAENARQRQAQAQANIEALNAIQADKEAKAKAEAKQLQVAENIQALEQAYIAQNTTPMTPPAKRDLAAEARENIAKLNQEHYTQTSKPQHTPLKTNQPPKRDLKAEAERRIAELQQDFANQQSPKSPSKPIAPINVPQKPQTIPPKRQEAIAEKRPASPDVSSKVQSILESMREKTAAIEPQKSAPTQQNEVSRRVEELNQAREQGREQERDAER